LDHNRETGLGYKKQEKLTNIEIQLTKLNMWQVVLGWNQKQIGALSSQAQEHAGGHIFAGWKSYKSWTIMTPGKLVLATKNAENAQSKYTRSTY